MSKRTIERFYAAFAQLDSHIMETCYAKDASFADEVFQLQGSEQIGAMWRMLCEATRAKGLAYWRIETSAVTENSAHWDATYLFSATGRKVLNRIDARFEFDAKGLITRHRDSFDFWSWSRQALGTPGVLLGWSPMLRNKVRAQAASNLRRFMAKG
jgi:hypothetical protein